MRRLIQQADLRQILPLLAAISILSGSRSFAQEQFPNELNSAESEPLVALPETPHKVPVRTASNEIQKSTDPLVQLVYKTREVQRQRLLSTTDHTPWQMMHGLLGLRQDFVISHNGQTVNGLEWIQSGPMYKNEPWFQKTEFGGQAHPFNKPYWFEGHINQFLAILAMCNVPLDAKFGTPQGAITMRDMLKNAQLTANEKEEVTWTLWALTTYLPPDAEWINAKGERWSIERLVQLEVAKRVGGPTSPCGGTHGLFALARARNVYLRTGKPLRGVWLDADQKIQRYIQTARNLQNANGTLSSSFFKGREYKQDFDKRMASCGHVLEFLMISLPQERLNEQWVRRAIEATANDLMANRKAYVSCSPLYHATDALSIYLDRVAPSPQPVVAQQPLNTKTISSSRDLKTAETPPNVAVTETKTSPMAASPSAVENSVPPKTVPPVPVINAGEASTVKNSEASESVSPLIMIPLPDPAGDIQSPAPALVPTPENPTENEGTKKDGPAQDSSSKEQPPEKKPLEEETRTVEAPPKIVAAQASQLPNITPESPPTNADGTLVIYAATVSRPARVASASSRTQVTANPQLIVSGERMETRAGLAEAIGPMLQPVPLQAMTVSSSAVLPPVQNMTEVAPKNFVQTAENVIGNGQLSTKSTASDVVTLPKDLSQVGIAPLAQGKHDGESPAGSPGTPREKNSGEWKSTPLERRKPIVVEESPSV